MGGIFSRFLRQNTNSGQIESFSRYIYEPGTDSGAESSFYSTTITRIIFVSATGSWRLARVTTPAVATTISPSLTIPFSFSSSTDANKSAVELHLADSRHARGKSRDQCFRTPFRKHSRRKSADTRSHNDRRFQIGGGRYG